MDRKRVIHNAKSRQSGQRKKVKKRQKSKTVEEHDPNATIIVPKSEEQKELDRREKLRLEVRIICSVSSYILTYDTTHISLLLSPTPRSTVRKRNGLRNISCVFSPLPRVAYSQVV